MVQGFKELACGGRQCMDGAGVWGNCLAAVRKEKERAPALALGAVREW